MSWSDHSVSVVTVIKAIVLDVLRIEILRTIRLWTRKCHKRDAVMMKMLWILFVLYIRGIRL